jgi:anti-sigma28 factor (negative regulator of flagellin synthesis)
MKIRERKDELQQEALRILDTNSQGAGAAKKKRDIFGREVSDDVHVDLALGKSIGHEFDPHTIAAERKARVEELKRQVQSGTYVLPPSDEIAKKLAEEINFEILSSPKDEDSDTVA